MSIMKFTTELAILLTVILIALVFTSPSWASGPLIDESIHQNQGQAQGQLQGQGQVQEQSQGNTQVTNYRRSTASAIAPGLTSGNDVCAGSKSIGGQAAGFGISFGTTWVDNNCVRLKNSARLEDLGFKTAAVALLCQDEEVAQAMAVAGTPCPGNTQGEPLPAAIAEQSAAASQANGMNCANRIDNVCYPMEPPKSIYTPMSPINN